MSSVTALLCRPDLTLGTVATELGNLNTVGVIGSWVRSRQMVAPTTKGKVSMVNIMDSRVQLAIRLVWLTQIYGFGYLITVFLEVKYIGNQLNSYLILYKQKSFRSGEQKSNLYHNNKELRPLNQVPNISQFTDSEPLNEGETESPWGRTPAHYQKFILLIFSLAYRVLPG